jgi:hypothetical protein
LVDGTSTFFLCDRRLRIGTLFVLNDATSNPETFLGSYALSKTLRGGDALFRVSAPSEFSITEPAGLEFVYKDNSWRVRDFPRLNEALQQSAGLSTDAAAALLFWVSDLSRRRQSALIWLPAAGIETSESLISQNALTKTGLSLRKPTHIATIARVLTSDGATIIDNEMNVRAYGCIVDSSKAKVSGVRGTGESVASYLGARGLAIKISQDGGVKVFPAPGVPPILL